MSKNKKPKIHLILAALVIAGTASAQNEFGEPVPPRPVAPPGANFGPDPFGGIPGVDPAGVQPGAPPMAVPRVKPDGTMHIRLRDGSNLIGKLSDVKQIKVKTSIGELSIPIEKVASFSFSGAKTAKIMLRNGDRITGELAIDKIKVTAPWGEVAVDVKFILQVTSKDLAGGFRTVRRSVIEVGPAGQRMVRDVEELVPIHRAQPGWNGDELGDPVSNPRGGFAPGGALPPPPTEAFPEGIPGAAAPGFPRASRRGR